MREVPGEDMWVTQVEAAELLRVHRSAVPKMLRRGDLTARRERPSLRRADVLALRDFRDEKARLHAEQGSVKLPAEPQTPDDEHDWVRADAVASFMGVGSTTAVHQRARRGRLPFTDGPDGTRWFRLDQVAMSLRAQEASRTKAVASDTG